MGKNEKNKKKGKGAEKTSFKTDKKLATKQKKLLEKIGEADIVEIVTKLEAAEAARKTVIETNCPPPSPRSNFSICTHPTKEELIIFGGEFFNGQKLTVYNEMYFYNIARNEWKLVQAPGGPGPRSAHQMVALPADGGQLWLFGGEHASPSQLQFYHYKDLWVYRVSEKKWEKIERPDGPSPRSGHRMVSMKKKLFTFGGFYDNGMSYKYFNDVWSFSMETYTWQELKIGGMIKPIPRSGCCMVPMPDGRILCWGGYSKAKVKKDVDRGVTHCDMFALGPDKHDSSGLTWKWVTVKAGGIRPQPRNGVIVTLSQNGNKAFVFGGVMDVDENDEDVQGVFSNELHTLDLLNPVWHIVELQGKKLPATKKLSAISKMEIVKNENTSDAVTTDGVFTMVVGGATTSKESNTTNSVKSSSISIPSPRMKVGLTVCKGNLYLYGGVIENGDKQQTLSDLYSIDINKMDTWNTIIKPDLNAHEWIDSDVTDSDDSETDDTDSDEDDSDSEMETN